MNPKKFFLFLAIQVAFFTASDGRAESCIWDDPEIWYKSELDGVRYIWAPPRKTTQDLCRANVYIDERPFSCEKVDRIEGKAALSTGKCESLSSSDFIFVSKIEDHELIKVLKLAEKFKSKYVFGKDFEIDIGKENLESIVVSEDDRTGKLLYVLLFKTTDKYLFIAVRVTLNRGQLNVVDVHELSQ